VNAIAGTSKGCIPQLNYTEEELEKQTEFYSRKLDPELLENALEIEENIKLQNPSWKGRPLVHTWELYDKAFTFSRVRTYKFVQDNMNMLQHFEDNLNLNPSSTKAQQDFLRVASTVRKNFNDKYGGDGGF
jgi:hypothetical protein